MVDHLALGVGALGHLGHVPLELARHVGRGDARGELVEGVDDGHAQLAGLHRVVLEVLHRVKALDDARARGLGAQAALLHLLDELALGVARGRLGLLGREHEVADVDRVALGEGRQLLVLLEAIGVNAAEARHLEHVARGAEGLAGHVYLQLRALDDGRVRERGEKAPGHEVVELPLGRLELGRVAHAGGVDGRVVGVELLAARGVDLGRLEQLIHVGRILRHAGEHLGRGAKVERGRVDGVVHARVRDEAVHVEALGQTHGARGREALGGRSGLQARGVERRGRALGALLLGDRRHRTAGCALDVREGRLGSLLVEEAALGVADLELVGALGAGQTADDPVVLRLEDEALALALHHEGQRGRLHAAGAANVAKPAEARHREVAREGSAPDEVDVLAALARVGQVLVEAHEVGEGVVDLALGVGRVAGARHRDAGVDLEHLREGVRADELALAVEVRADDHRVGLLGEVLERSDDALLGRELLDGRPDQVGQAGNLPALDVHAVLQKRLLLLERGTRQAVRHVGRQDLALL